MMMICATLWSLLWCPSSVSPLCTDAPVDNIFVSSVYHLSSSGSCGSVISCRISLAFLNSKSILLYDLFHFFHFFTTQQQTSFIVLSSTLPPFLPQFNPKLAESELSSKAMAKLVTMTLFLVPGTPILHGIEEDYLATEKGFIESLSQFREKESVQVGDMTFVNTTSDDVIAFARWV